MIQLKKTLLTLVALLALTMHAWAQEQSETIATTAKTVEGTHFTISNNGKYADGDGMYALDDGITVTAKNGETITKVVISNIYDSDKVNDGNTSVSSGTKEITNGGGTITVTGVNASTFNFTCSENGPQFGQFVVYYTEAPAAPASVDLTRGTGDKINEWTLTNGMPAGNVTVSVDYFPQAALTEAPTAINDVPATTDGDIVKAGTVANIGSTETAQGTVMYYVSTTALDDDALLALDTDAWTDDVPTAESLAQGQAYVYYYVRGNDSDTDDENFSDGDILAANALTVTIAAEPTYAVTFADGVNPEPPAEPEWTASPNADVKKGQTVTVTYTGDRKVIGVKAEKKKVLVTSITLNQTGTIARYNGDSGTLSVTSVLPEDATDKTYTWSSSDPLAVSIDQNGNWRVVGRSGSNANLRATANDGSGVYAQISVWVR